MRLHWRLLFSRFGLFSILPMFLTAVVGAAYYGASFAPVIFHGEFVDVPLRLFPLLWLLAAFSLGLISAFHHGRFWLAPLAPAAIFFVFMAFALWLLHGLRGLATGREPQRDKPTRYADVVA